SRGRSLPRLTVGLRLLPGCGALFFRHAQLLQLASEGIAAPAEELRGFLAVALCAPQRSADQDALQGRQRQLQERTLAAQRLPLRPAGEGFFPIGVSRGCAGAENLRRQILDMHFAARRQHGEPPAEVDELAYVAGPGVYRQLRLRLPGEDLA